MRISPGRNRRHREDARPQCGTRHGQTGPSGPSRRRWEPLGRTSAPLEDAARTPVCGRARCGGSSPSPLPGRRPGNAWRGSRAEALSAGLGAQGDAKNAAGAGRAASRPRARPGAGKCGRGLRWRAGRPGRARSCLSGGPRNWFTRGRFSLFERKHYTSSLTS